MHKNPLPILLLMVVFSPLAIDLFLPALPVMAEFFSISISQMQWSVHAFMLSMGLGQLISGPSADRWGRRPVAIAGVLLYSLASIAAAYTTTLEWFLLCRLAQGFGACAIVVSAFSIVRDRYDALRSGMMYSYLNGAICVIPALAPILGGILTDLFDWQANFEAMALYAAAAGLVVFKLLPETRPETTVRPKTLLSVSSFAPVIKNPKFLFNALMVMLSMSVILVYVSSSPAWLMMTLGLDQSAFVFWFSMNAVVNIAACLIAPKILTKVGPKRTIGLGMWVMCAAGIAMLAMMHLQSAAAYMIPVMLSSVAVSLLMGSCSGQALSDFSDSAGAASALLGFLQMSGSAVLVYLVQLLPVDEPLQFAALSLVIVPVYLLWRRPAVKKVLYGNSELASVEG